MVSREDNGKEIKCEISNTVFPTVNIEAHAFVNITCKYEGPAKRFVTGFG